MYIGPWQDYMMLRRHRFPRLEGRFAHDNCKPPHRHCSPSSVRKPYKVKPSPQSRRPQIARQTDECWSVERHGASGLSGCALEAKRKVSIVETRQPKGSSSSGTASMRKSRLDRVRMMKASYLQSSDAYLDNRGSGRDDPITLACMPSTESGPERPETPQVGDVEEECKPSRRKSLSRDEEEDLMRWAQELSDPEDS